MQQMAEVAERKWLDTWPETVQKEARGQTDTADAYEIMTRMSEDEVEELNLYKLNIKTPDVYP